MIQDGTQKRPIRVALCVTCLGDAICPEVGEATVRILRCLGVKYPRISDAMLQKKVAALQRAGVNTLVSCDAGCLLHIAGRLHRPGDTIRLMHLELKENGHYEPCQTVGARRAVSAL